MQVGLNLSSKCGIISNMNTDVLYFINFVIFACARAWGRRPADVYKRLKSGAALDYLAANYEVLHTQGEEYLTQSMADFLAKKKVYA